MKHAAASSDKRRLKVTQYQPLFHGGRSAQCANRGEWPPQNHNLTLPTRQAFSIFQSAPRMLRVVSAIFLLLNALSPASGEPRKTPGDEGGAAALRQDAYVWQRAWTAPVTNAVGTLAPKFGELIALQTEVSWDQGNPRCTRGGSGLLGTSRVWSAGGARPAHRQFFRPVCGRRIRARLISPRLPKPWWPKRLRISFTPPSCNWISIARNPSWPATASG